MRFRKVPISGCARANVSIPPFYRISNSFVGCWTANGWITCSRFMGCGDRSVVLHEQYHKHQLSRSSTDSQAIPFKLWFPHGWYHRSRIVESSARHIPKDERNPNVSCRMNLVRERLTSSPLASNFTATMSLLIF